MINSNLTSIRYQLTNHLGSASLELNETGEIISYEEYHPFGTTSYRSGRSEVVVSLKRYKYVFKELDNETGLYYYGMRYYASWIARFISVDPLQFEYPIYTPFQYAGNKPISYIDLDGAEEWKTLTDIKDKVTQKVENLAKSFVRFGKAVGNVAKNYIDDATKTKIQSSTYKGFKRAKSGKLIKKESPVYEVSLSIFRPNDSFSTEQIDSIKSLYHKYMEIWPPKLSPNASNARCIDIMNWSLSEFYNIDRMMFVNKKHDDNHVVRETVDFTGEQFYKFGNVTNFKELTATYSSNDEVLTLGGNIKESLIEMTSNKTGNYFFIVTAGSGLHTTAIFLSNADNKDPIFEVWDKNGNKDPVSFQEFYKIYTIKKDKFDNTRIYQLKPPNK